jgi:mannose-6-phosphate isomerase-like protein (cupin superfamily)
MSHSSSLPADPVFERVAALLNGAGFRIWQQDLQRPWGGFYVIEESQAADFIRHFFPDESADELLIASRLSPKLLLVAPRKRLSWQYHFRRAELWRCLEGPVSVATSDDDEEKHLFTLQPGDSIRLRQGERHRLIGGEHWGVVAEIWKHTDAAHPSDEEDIVRLQDDFGRGQ